MTRVTKTITVVQCAKIGLELEALDRPPFPGPLGQRIYDNVSKEGWRLWQGQATLLINHYGLNMVDPRAQELLFEQMEQFFFGDDAQMPEGWTPEGSGPATKGGPAPRK